MFQISPPNYSSFTKNNREKAKKHQYFEPYHTYENMTERYAEFVGQLHEHVLTYIIVAGDEGSSWKSTYMTEAKNVNDQMYFSRPNFISKGCWPCLFSTFCYCETWIHMRFIKTKLSPRPSICSVRRHVKHKRVHDHVSFASGNFLASMVSFLFLNFL